MISKIVCLMWFVAAIGWFARGKPELGLLCALLIQLERLIDVASSRRKETP